MSLAALFLALLLGGPTGLQALHSPSAEQSQQEAIVERLRSHEPREIARADPPPDPDSPAERRAAAWRADHLTCTSRRGRSREQYQRECAAWAAEQAAREAAAR